ncbi:MAG TPA: hypothetical protein VIF62_24570 [Labilithrix sp.]|jgi:hypothetical protein
MSPYRGGPEEPVARAEKEEADLRAFLPAVRTAGRERYVPLGILLSGAGLTALMFAAPLVAANAAAAAVAVAGAAAATLGARIAIRRRLRW